MDTNTGDAQMMIKITEEVGIIGWNAARRRKMNTGDDKGDRKYRRDAEDDRDYGRDTWPWDDRVYRRVERYMADEEDSVDKERQEVQKNITRRARGCAEDPNVDDSSTDGKVHMWKGPE